MENEALSIGDFVRVKILFGGRGNLRRIIEMDGRMYLTMRIDGRCDWVSKTLLESAGIITDKEKEEWAILIFKT